jgi:hypothetical protein
VVPPQTHEGFSVTTTAILDGLGELADKVGKALDPMANVTVIGTLVGVLVVIALLRAGAIRLALRRRVFWAALPADEFDPAPEDVSRFAFQISRVRRAVRGWLERPASAVRIRLDAVPEGQMLYVIEGPAHARSVLRAATYDRVELRDLDELDLFALSLRPDLPDDQAAGGDVDAPRPVRGEPLEPELDDPREDLEQDWLKEDRW